MNEYLKAAVDGSLAGIRETPRGFFAPAIAFFKWAKRITDSVVGEAKGQTQSNPAGHH